MACAIIAECFVKVKRLLRRPFKRDIHRPTSTVHTVEIGYHGTGHKMGDENSWVQLRDSTHKKGPSTTDFLNEYTANGVENPRSKVAEDKLEWHMQIDGARNHNGAGIGIILDNGKIVTLE